jgi:hypothetical protein
MRPRRLRLTPPTDEPTREEPNDDHPNDRARRAVQRSRRGADQLVSDGEAIERAELFWISTVRADGRPNITPLVAVWLDDALCFCTGPSEQKAHNLATNPHVVLTTVTNEWRSGLDIVVEGQAVRVTDTLQLRALAERGGASGTAGGNTSPLRTGFTRHWCTRSRRRRSSCSARERSATPATGSKLERSPPTFRESDQSPASRGKQRPHVANRRLSG